MDQLRAWLRHEEEAGRRRILKPLASRERGRVVLAGSDHSLIDFSSNDYLALSCHPALIAAAQEALIRFGAGSGAARLMSGDLFCHHQLEEAVAKLKGKEAALIFGSGYMANTGLIPALVGRNDTIFGDRLNHASIYDGCRLSGARLLRFRHNDLGHLEELLRNKRGAGRALIVVESLYSMDGDRAPLAELVALKKRFDCLLLVDEAHATGLFGARGGGIVEEDGVVDGVDLVLGTFGKALGSYGAFVAGSRFLMDVLINRARSFVFSTALPPSVVAASLAAVRLVQKETMLRQELWQKVAFFKQLLFEGGCSAPLGPSQIIPIPVGSSLDAVEAADRLRAAGLFVTAVRPPTVPEGSARLRLSITRHHSEADLALAAAALLSIPAGNGSAS